MLAAASGLATVMALAGCSTATIEDSPLFTAMAGNVAPADYKELVRPYGTLFFKDEAAANSLEVSKVRRAHALGAGDWISCVRAANADKPPVAVFIEDGKVVNFRIAVKVDGCETDQFEQL